MVKEQVLNRVLAVYFAAPQQMAILWADLFFQLAIWLLCVLIPVALLDYAYTHWDFMQQMMMSTADVKDEHKKREGDPQIKSKQKQIQKELMKKAASLGRVKDADVIVTNPTHIAVALRYQHQNMPAPQVMAMGQGSTAEKIKHIARVHHIPIVHNKAVARRVFKGSVIDGYIPFDCYALVAGIFRQVMTNKGEKIGG
ncbi:MAG: flagellar biosynthetic protein FlhB [Phenylobacterium sp.]|jgi:flagellar biosynthetic protein FlhB